MQDVVIGVNQSIRQVKKNNAKIVYIAKDAEAIVINELVELCGKQNIEIKYIETMKELGKIFKISIKSAAGAILKKGGE